jgi:hypothetical protein
VIATSAASRPLASNFEQVQADQQPIAVAETTREKKTMASSGLSTAIWPAPGTPDRTDRIGHDSVSRQAHILAGANPAAPIAKTITVAGDRNRGLMTM